MGLRLTMFIVLEWFQNFKMSPPLIAQLFNIAKAVEDSITHTVFLLHLGFYYLLSLKTTNEASKENQRLRRSNLIDFAKACYFHNEDSCSCIIIPFIQIEEFECFSFIIS